MEIALESAVRRGFLSDLNYSPIADFIKNDGTAFLLSYLNSNSSSIVRKSILFMLATVSFSGVEASAGMVSSGVCVSSGMSKLSILVSFLYVLHIEWRASDFLLMPPAASRKSYHTLIP